MRGLSPQEIDLELTSSVPKYWKFRVGLVSNSRSVLVNFSTKDASGHLEEFICVSGLLKAVGDGMSCQVTAIRLVSLRRLRSAGRPAGARLTTLPQSSTVAIYAAINTTRNQGRCLKAERLCMGFPQGRYADGANAHEWRGHAHGARWSDQGRARSKPELR